MKVNIGVGIPTYNRYDILEPNLKKYSLDFPYCQIYIVDNGNQGINKNLRLDYDMMRLKSGSWRPQDGKSWAGITLIENQTNVGVGASWNQLCVEIFKHSEYALILNDDIYLGKNYPEVISFISSKNVGFVRATPDWCAFVISKEIYEYIGPFDECFMPAYYEDKSYEYRMKLKGIRVLKHPHFNPLIYQSSKTLEKEPAIQDLAKKNKKLYIDMWGGEPGKETFKLPFDGKPKP